MIISRTPLRMSLVGGGSDLPVFYRRFGGAVVSAAIDKFVYVTVNRKFDHRIRVSYSRTEDAASVGRIRHPLVREAMRMLKIDGGVEITSIADIPSKGSGLGSSSSFTVGLLHALHAYGGRHVSAESLAREACEIELVRCGEPIGKQDQYAAAYGGLNFIQFHQDDTVSVEPIICKPKALADLQASIVAFYTGVTRSASAILRRQRQGLNTERAKQKAMLRMVQYARELRAELQKGNTGALGEAIHENWLLKRSLGGDISTTRIDDWYKRARKAGAVGGKLLGAGAGGFLIFVAPPGRHEAIARELSELRRMQFAIEKPGSRIIFVHE
jgi:D-glycero-alpha-D-manno-heptose-7-phosphate kinase